MSDTAAADRIMAYFASIKLTRIPSSVKMSTATMEELRRRIPSSDQKLSPYAGLGRMEIEIDDDLIPGEYTIFDQHGDVILKGKK